MMDKVMMINKLAQRKDFRQFIKFNMVGVLNTLVDIGVFTLLTFLGLNKYIAKVFSCACGMLNSYICNKRWTFKQKSASGGTEIMKFIVVNLVALGVSLSFLKFFSEYMHIVVWLSNILATGFSLVVNFIGNKFWVFKSANEGQGEENA